ncbi:RhuM family protein [Dyadobacter sp. CY347]|uniref:RhuM family protein n=1 Tax=Dyadobacter sp. CY347 TaxID=2909336 RepID=UPI001F2CA2E7|nr:RhuM family protein [Dyadobacter sp. CY347]MCF2487611.1 virulence RhuM family protein [Dyadobacter sp. CY347]
MSNELDESATVRKFRTVQQEGNRLIERDRVHYNLDVIIAVGYRVNTKQGTKFRQWASQRLKDYLIHGYAINEQRLTQKEQQVQTLSV